MRQSQTAGLLHSPAYIHPWKARLSAPSNSVKTVIRVDMLSLLQLAFLKPTDSLSLASVNTESKQNLILATLNKDIRLMLLSWFFCYLWDFFNSLMSFLPKALNCKRWGALLLAIAHICAGNKQKILGVESCHGQGESAWRFPCLELPLPIYLLPNIGQKKLHLESPLETIKSWLFENLN